MREEILKIAQKLTTTTGATGTALMDLSSALGHSLPDQYMEFMRFSNGAEGSIAECSYLVIWPIEEIISLNELNAVRDVAPELLLFGSDSGSTGYAFDTSSADMPIVQVDLILTDVREPVASTFFEFLEKLAAK